MKKLLMILALSVALISPVLGADVWFTWTQNPPIELVSSYRMEYQKLPAVTTWTFLTSVPGTTNVAVVKGIQGGYTYKFRMFAQNSLGVGTNLSNVIQIPTNTPSAVLNYTLTNAPGQ